MTIEIFVYHGGVADGAGRGQRIKDFLDARNQEYTYLDGYNVRQHNLVTIPSVIVFKTLSDEAFLLKEFTEQDQGDNQLDLVALGVLLDAPPEVVKISTDKNIIHGANADFCTITLRTENLSTPILVTITDEDQNEATKSVDIVDGVGSFTLASEAIGFLNITLPVGYVYTPLRIEVI